MKTMFSKFIHSVWTQLFGGFTLFFIIYALCQAQIPEASSGEAWHSGIIALLGTSVQIGLYILTFYYWDKRRHITELSVTEAPVSILSGAGFGFLMIGTSVLMMYLSGVYHVTGKAWVTELLISKLLYWLFVATGEEIIFRGVLYRLLEKRWNTATALTVSSLLFGFAHFFNDNATLWSCIAITLEAGLLLGAAFSYSRNLWLPIGLHWTWNFSTCNVFGLPVSGYKEEYSLFSTFTEGNEWLTGGSFGPENSVFTVTLGVLLTLFFLYKRKALPRI